MAIVSTDPNDPVELKHMFPPKIANAFETIPPYMAAMDEDDLRVEAKPNETDWKLRIRLWQEYRASCDAIKGAYFPKVRADLVCQSICSFTHFCRILDKPHKAAFILRPMQDFEQETELLLQISTQRLYQLVNMDFMNDKTGKVDPKLAGVFLQARRMIEDRARGLAIARTQAINYNLNQDSTPKEQSTNPQDLDDRIRELEGKLKGTIEGEIIDDTESRREKLPQEKET